MSADRELLELAAKAAGLVLLAVPIRQQTDFDWWAYRYDAAPNTAAPWNPLTDDGDALRLAVQLNLLVGCHHAEAWAQFYRPDGKWFTAKEPHDSDPTGATRRAIARAAAELGRLMP